MPGVSPAQCVVRAFGGVRKTARAVGRTPGAVVAWRKTGNVPGAVQRRVLALAEAGDITITATQLIKGDDNQA